MQDINNDIIFKMISIFEKVDILDIFKFKES